MWQVRWGSVCEVFTPAFWAAQCWCAEQSETPITYKLGKTLAEEVAGALLGGYGIPAEVGLAALSRLRDEGLLERGTLASYEQILGALTSPLFVNGKPFRYRFAKQKSQRLSKILPLLWEEEAPEDDYEFRRWLLRFPGIGPKTASWITRNWKNCNSVAIVDIHVWRAGQLMGLFQSQTPAKDYFEMEGLFLSLAIGLGVKASVLDTVIWSRMRLASNLARAVAA
jgi:hypothetical protein